VITGSQKAFAAGADIREMVDQSYGEMYAADWFGQWEGFAALPSGAGLMSRIVAKERLLEEASKVADAIAGMSVPSVLMCKGVMNRAFEVPLSEGIRFERRLFHSLFATEDQRERNGSLSR
jgi:enoyl-CoA hydratase/carnithine racemase